MVRLLGISTVVIALIAMPSAGQIGQKAKSRLKAKGQAPSKATFNDAPTAEQLAFFEKKIRPILIDNCYSCHSAEAKKLKGDLRLDTRDDLRRGGTNGPVVVSGDASKSPLIRAIKSTDESARMPPKGSLSESAIADLERWVRMGAPDPRTGETMAHRSIDIEKGKQFWAFRPVNPGKANVKERVGAPSPVDEIIDEALNARKLNPVAEADERTLFRRLHLDLTGLPPTPDEVEAYVFDQSKAKYEKAVDQLLASPRFGERWGRHWLDVARFGESTGKSVNFNYPHAWRYRDYVIDAFNADKPFDQFVKEQLAGDLLPASSDKQRAEQMIATGFLAIGAKSLNERNPIQFQLDVADEQIDAFSQAFLGITAACARCHDHKFDPIPTADYYSLVGIFRSTETCYGTINSIQARYATPLIPIPPGADAPPGLPPLPSRERDQLERQLRRLKGDLAEMTKKIGAKESFLAAGGVRNRIQIATLEARLDLFEKDGAPKKLAMGAREKNRARNSPIYQRGEPDKPGAEVPRGVLQVIGPTTRIAQGSGRMELAEWVASPENPLTARVYVNRVWLHLFGRGIVATPDNFGANGQPPTNPELLDHLAQWFMDHGWSTKQLVKYLVMSNAYRRSTRPDEHNLEVDPDNEWNWRMSPGRLDAETIRDAMLAVAGNLDVNPPRSSPVTRGGDGYSAAMNRPGGMIGGRPAGEPNTRSVYLPIVRDNLPESLSLFDAADPSLVTGERAKTTVPAQALFLMNNPFVIKQAEAAAERLRTQATTDTERVRAAYLLFFGRPPREPELARASEFLATYGSNHKPRETWTAFCQALFGSAEFLFRN